MSRVKRYRYRIETDAVHEGEFTAKSDGAANQELKRIIEKDHVDVNIISKILMDLGEEHR